MLYVARLQAFWTFATLMQHCGLSGLFTDGFPYLNQCYDIWQTLFPKLLPRLSSHVAKQLLGFLGMEEKEFKEMIKQQSSKFINTTLTFNKEDTINMPPLEAYISADDSEASV